MSTYTKGNVIVENIKIGDIHYEYEYNVGIKVEVITLPTKNEDNFWSWKSKVCSKPEVTIDYGVTEGMAHYAPNLYDYEAYKVKHLI